MNHRLLTLLSYALLSLVPFIPYLYGETVENVLWVVGVEFVFWGGVWAMFGRPSRFHPLLLPAFLVLPADIYLYTHYHQGISARHIGMLFDTSTREMLEFLGDKLWWMFATLIISFIWWWSVWRATRATTALNWTHYSRKFALFGLCILSLYSPHWRNISDRVFLGDTRPFGWLFSTHEYWLEHQRLSELKHANQNFKFGAYQEAGDDKPLVIVMVIGESSRADRWSLNGYARETNPMLGKEKNLVNAPDMITPVSSTLLSLPIILSRKGTQNTFRTGFAEKSLISAFKEAGFKTYWLSNQIPFGEYDTPVSVFAKEADVVQFLNLGSYSDISNFDDILFAPLNAAIENSEPKKLIILHTLGNHWNYSRRYPQDFDHWQPSLFGLPNPDHTNANLKTEINNSYDNSVLYTDWFLSRTIEILKTRTTMSAMLYISDHGENLHEGECDYVLHGHNSQADFHVPMVLWYSDAYGQANPNKVAQMRRNATAKLSTDTIFHSMLDMAHIHYPSEQLEWSLFGNKFKIYERYVDSYGWADYDHANFKGDCKEVIDKGAPLPRSKEPM